MKDRAIIIFTIIAMFMGAAWLFRYQISSYVVLGPIGENNHGTNVFPSEYPFDVPELAYGPKQSSFGYSFHLPAEFEAKRLKTSRKSSTTEVFDIKNVTMFVVTKPSLKTDFHYQMMEGLDAEQRQAISFYLGDKVDSQYTMYRAIVSATPSSRSFFFKPD